MTGLMNHTKLIVDDAMTWTYADSLDTLQGMKNFGRCAPCSAPSAMVHAYINAYRKDEVYAWLKKWLQIQTVRASLMSTFPPSFDPVTDLLPGPLKFNLWSPMHLTTCGLADLAISGPLDLRAEAVNALAALVKSVLGNTVWQYVHQEADAPNFLSYGGRWRIAAGLVEFHLDMRRVAHAEGATAMLPPQADHLTSTLQGILLNAPLLDGPGAEHYNGPHLCLWMVGRAYAQLMRAQIAASYNANLFTPAEVDLIDKVLALANVILASYAGIPELDGGVAYDVVADPANTKLLPAPGTPFATFGSTPQWAYLWAATNPHIETAYAQYLRSAAQAVPLVTAYQTTNFPLSSNSQKWS